MASSLGRFSLPAVSLNLIVFWKIWIKLNIYTLVFTSVLKDNQSESWMRFTPDILFTAQNELTGDFN